MLYENGKVTDVRLAYIGGGSRGWAWKFMADLAAEASISGEVRLYDIDRKAAEANETIGNKMDALPETRGHWHYRAVESRQEALEGADFVIISILPGTFDEMAVDVHLPERLGIYQSVGDTAGPGGMIRALRTLPMMVPIAEDVKRFCPQAWVINYTNPMSLCVQILYHTFPEIKAFGCCHEVFGTQKLLSAVAAEMLSVPAPDRRQIHTNVLGINHFTWFDSASFEGVDLFPFYRLFVEKYYNSGFMEEGSDWTKSTFDCAHRVKFDLFKRFGLIAAAGDRHLVEFMPGNEYLKDPETVRSWKFGLTSVDWRKADLKDRLEKSRQMISGERPLETEPSGEEGVLLIKALLGLGRMVSNVNLPNRGQIENLPLGTVVESNAVFSKDSVRPVLAGALPESIRALMLPHVENHKRILEASLSCEEETVVQAFLADPNVSARLIPEDRIRALVRDMIRETAAFLPEGWKR